MSTYSEDTLNHLIARLGKVRRWLLALGLLRTATVWLAVVLLYVDSYVALDHRLHFGPTARIAALAGLMAILAILACLLVRTLRRDMSYTHAARYVEARHSFDQQLVAAVEFYEKGADYPYSPRLARQLVLNVDEVCRDFAFDSTVNKQQGYLLAGCIGSCLILVSLFICGNLQHFRRSLVGLVNPLATVEPAAPPQTPQAGPAPGIEEIVAAVRASPTSDESTQKVTHSALEVLSGSQVELRVKTTTPLREVTIDGIEGKPIVQELDGAREFRVPFEADKPLSLSFRLVNTDGVANAGPLTMQVSLKSDAPPEFKLLSPEGDCLTTDVASIPIAFEVTDDCGLAHTQLCCQLPAGVVVVLDSNSPHGARQAHLSAILELEQYDLSVGDCLQFYAKASEAATLPRQGDPNVCSEMYLVEIRPYHQYWHPQPSGGPSQTPGPSPEDLITILEYTRGIVKKTWALAQPPQRQPQEYGKLTSDTEYCAKRLATMRDDPDNRFTNEEKAALTHIISPYDNVTSALAARDAGKAVAPAQEAYRLLRKFIDELHLKWNPPDTGKSVPEEKPERVKLQEPPKSEQDPQRAESQLEKAQNAIDALAQQEKALKADIAKTARKQNQQAGGKNGKGQQGTQGRAANESSAEPGQGKGTEPSQEKSGNESPSTDALLRMLAARQNALRQQAAQISADLAKLALPSSSGRAGAKDAARQSLDQAAGKMKQLEDKLGEARYSSESSGKKEANMEALAESATHELTQAGQAITKALADGRQMTDAEKAEALARQLARDAEVFDESTTPQQKQEMLDRLKAAEQLLERMEKPGTQTVSSSGGGVASQGYTRNAFTTPGQTARALSGQFWSVAIQARSRQMRGTENEPSDARFFESENKFFEDAAKFRPPSGPK